MLRRAGCDQVVAVVPDDLVDDASQLCRSSGVSVTPGGATRRDSVAAGLGLVEAPRVVVHDAARPFASPELVARVIAALSHADGAIAAVPVDETVKRAANQHVLETVDRTALWRAQTPQAFVTAVLREAHDRARRDGFDATDDAQLVERYGGTVVIVEGSRSNIKLTSPDDFVLAEAMVAAR